MADRTLELVDGPGGSSRREGRVPPPLPPEDPEAWYAPDVQAQYEVYPDVVVTIERTDGDFAYHVREPVLTAADRAASTASSHTSRTRTSSGRAPTRARSR